MSTSTTAPITSQSPTKSSLSMMEKLIAGLGDTLSRFADGQTRASCGISSGQRNQSRSR